MRAHRSSSSYVDVLPLAWRHAVDYTVVLSVQVGFKMRKITKGRVSMKVWDIGGQPRFRSMWERYCRGVNAIVFVVDSADLGKIDEARKLLHDLMQRPSLQGTPLLVLGNKSDLDQSLSGADLTSQMQLQV